MKIKSNIEREYNIRNNIYSFLNLKLILITVLFISIVSLKVNVYAITLLAPQDVKVNVSSIKTNETTTLSWKKSDNATSYIIDGWNHKGEEFMWKNVGNVTSYEISGLTEGKYSFYIIAKNGDSSSPSSLPATLTVNNLDTCQIFLSKSVIDVGTTSLLTWTKASGAEKYTVYGWHNGRMILEADVTDRGSLDLYFTEVGDYSFYIVASNALGSTTSNKVGLTIISSKTQENKLSVNNTSKTGILKTGILKSVKSLKKKSMKVTWKRLNGITGYQLYISPKKNFSSKTIQRKYKMKKSNITIIGFKSKKKYYVKLRPYKKVGKMIYYGNWSKTKSVKIK